MKNTTDYIKKRVDKEKSKKTLTDDYGPFWFWVGEVLGNWIFGFLGAAFDTVTLWGFVFLLTKLFWFSLFIAIVLAVSIQIVFGKSVVRAVKTAHRGDIKKTNNPQYKGFRRQLAVTAIIAVSMLTASLYISRISDSPVKARTEILREQKMIDIEAIKRPYLARIEKERTEAINEEKVVREEVQALRDDKVHDSKGRLVTRYAHLKTINNKINAYTTFLNIYQSGIEI